MSSGEQLVCSSRQLSSCSKDHTLFSQRHEGHWEQGNERWGENGAAGDPAEGGQTHCRGGWPQIWGGKFLSSPHFSPLSTTCSRFFAFKRQLPSVTSLVSWPLFKLVHFDFRWPVSWWSLRATWNVQRSVLSCLRGKAVLPWLASPYSVWKLLLGFLCSNVIHYAD